MALGRDEATRSIPVGVRDHRDVEAAAVRGVAYPIQRLAAAIIFPGGAAIGAAASISIESSRLLGRLRKNGSLEMWRDEEMGLGAQGVEFGLDGFDVPHLLAAKQDA
jgi:hypothetical protein